MSQVGGSTTPNESGSAQQSKRGSSQRSPSRGSSFVTSRTNSSKKTVLSKETIEEIERPQWEIDEERRKKELVEFLEDLGNSEEYQEFLNEKQRKKQEAEKNDAEIEEIKIEEKEKFPLTSKTLLQRKSKRRFENLLVNRINKQKLKSQNESIERIRVSSDLFFAIKF